MQTAVISFYVDVTHMKQFFSSLKFVKKHFVQARNKRHIFNVNFFYVKQYNIISKDL